VVANLVFAEHPLREVEGHCAMADGTDHPRRE
jgi:hypothetical protein